jgi:GDP-4-dehydro-6-deoxy-D-mannose reductase
VYGASKAAADLAAAQWSRAYGLAIVRARPFNHTGPGQDAAFLCSALARQVALIEAGRQPPELRVGNVDPVRDFSDVRDIAAGYVALLERGRAGEAYNLCRGEGVSVSEVIALLRTHARVPLRARSEPGLRRHNDVERVVGSPERARRDAGWQARIPFDESLAALLDDWRTRISREA